MQKQSESERITIGLREERDELIKKNLELQRNNLKLEADFTKAKEHLDFTKQWQ